MNHIETQRLTLRPWREDDARSLFRYASDDRVSRLALWPRHESVEESLAVIKNIFIPNPSTFAVELKETGEAIGCIGLVPRGSEHYDIIGRQREVGYWIGYPYWNNGITTEALHAMIAYCRDALRLESLLITTDPDNVASQRVAEKCGFRFICDYTRDGISGKAFTLVLK